VAWQPLPLVSLEKTDNTTGSLGTTSLSLGDPIMKKLFTLILIFTCVTASAAQITAGNLLVFRCDGNGAALSSDGTIVKVDEYDNTGAFVQTFSMPAGDTGTRLVASGSATSEGKLSFSPNGQWAVLIGYDAAENVAGVKSTINRTIARIKALDGTVDLSTTGPLGGNDNTRGVTVNNAGDKCWAAMAGTTGTSDTGRGPRYIPFGSTNVGIQLADINTRGCSIYTDQLYEWGDASGNYGVYEVGSGVPETSAQSLTGLTGISGDSALDTYGFFMADLDATEAGNDTLWMARDAAGVSKYSKISGTWTLNNTVDPGTVYHIAGIKDAGNNVSIYIVEGSAGGSTRIMKMTDTAGYNANMSEAAFTEIIGDASANEAFRGVAIAAIPEPAVLGLLAAALALVRRR